MENNNPYTEAERQAIRKNYQTMTAKQIAQLIGRSVHSVRDQAAKMGLHLQKRGDLHHSRKYPLEDIELARQLHAAGMKPSEICEKLEILPISIGNYLY